MNLKQRIRPTAPLDITHPSASRMKSQGLSLITHLLPSSLCISWSGQAPSTPPPRCPARPSRSDHPQAPWRHLHPGSREQLSLWFQACCVLWDLRRIRGWNLLQAEGTSFSGVPSASCSLCPYEASCSLCLHEASSGQEEHPFHVWVWTRSRLFGNWTPRGLRLTSY